VLQQRSQLALVRVQRGRPVSPASALTGSAVAVRLRCAGRSLISPDVIFNRRRVESRAGTARVEEL
jgi:hypothetical protein